MPTKAREPRKPSRPPAFQDTFRARTVRVSLTSGNGRETDSERIAKLEALLEKMQADLDIQMNRTAAIQAQLDALVAKQLR
jgi:hypothetical protein